jgi:hypothetical protein
VDGAFRTRHHWEFPERPDPNGKIARDGRSRRDVAGGSRVVRQPQYRLVDEIWTKAAEHILTHRPNLLMFHLLNSTRPSTAMDRDASRDDHDGASDAQVRGSFARSSRPGWRRRPRSWWSITASSWSRQIRVNAAFAAPD